MYLFEKSIHNSCKSRYNKHVPTHHFRFRGIAMDVMKLNHFIWRCAEYFVKEHSFFLIDQEEGAIILRRSDGFMTTFLWLIPADGLSHKRMRRELDDTLTWMSSYRRKTPSLLFHSIHLFIYSTPQSISHLQQIASMGAQSLVGRYQSSAWALDLTTGQLATPRLFFLRPRRLKEAMQQAIELYQTDIRNGLIQSQDIYTHIVKWQHQISSHQRQVQQSYQRSVRYTMGATITFGIAFINLVVWVLMTVAGGSQNPDILRLFGAKDNSLIQAGEYWRLLTPMFLHIGGLHLWFNSTALLTIGGPVERIYGKVRFLLIYLFAGIFGNLSSYMFSPHLSAGASGAIFGLFGALLLFATKRPSVFGHTTGPGLITGLIVNIILGFVIPGIDNYAHLGGLLGGFLAAVVVGLPKGEETKYVLK